MTQSLSEVMARVESGQNYQRSMDASVPRPMIEQLLESEIVFNIVAPIFTIFFVTGLAFWAAIGFLRDAVNWAVHSRQISR